MEKKSIRIRRLKTAASSEFDKESPNHYNWRKSVIDGHNQTSQLWSKVLCESKTSRIRLEKSCEEVRKVIDVWNEYGERFNGWIRNLANRIANNEKEEEERRIRDELAKQKKYRITRPTMLSRWRMREKFIPEPILPSFKFQRAHIYNY